MAEHEHEHAQSENPIEEGEKKVKGLLKSEPWYVWAGAAVAAGLVLYYVWQRRQQAASPAAAAPATDTTAPATDTTADPTGYGYQSGPVSNYPSGFSEVGVNGQNVPVVPYGDTPIYDASGNLIGWQQPNPTGSPSPAPTPAPTQTGTIRPLQTSGQTSGYDKNNPGGVPFRATPGGSVLGDVPYGSTVKITGSPVQGKDNFSSDPQHIGSLLWFPVMVNGQAGFVSAFDIINVVAGGQGSGGQADGFHLPVNAGRATMDQWAFSNGMHQDFDSRAAVGE